MFPRHSRVSDRLYQSVDGTGPPATAHVSYADGASIPEYLLRHCWRAYVHPRAVKLFDRPWLINLILLGNCRRLRNAALAEFGAAPLGNILQVACAYGDPSPMLARRTAAQKGAFDVVDVLPILQKNLKWKLPARRPTHLHCMDSTDLNLLDRRYDWVLLFFPLHEQPATERVKTLAEALRVLKPGGRLRIVDYGKPRWWNPLRYLLRPFLAVLEPFALDLWRDDLASLLPPGMTVRRQSYFGGVYQKVVASRQPARI